MRPKLLLSSALTLAAGVAVFACGAGKATAPAEPDGVEALRSSLAPYTSFSMAQNAGYDMPLTDCMSNGDLGAMGVHYGKPALIDGTVSPLQPEVLIYEPGANGERSLVGVEFIIPFAVRPQSSEPPELFGQKFTADQTFGLWALHVWTQRANPNGLFAPWNPRVHC